MGRAISPKSSSPFQAEPDPSCCIVYGDYSVFAGARAVWSDLALATSLDVAPVDFSMRSWAKVYETPTKVTTVQAKELFDSAPRLEPDNIDAMLGKARCIYRGVVFGWSTSVVEDKMTATSLVDQVLAKRPATADAHIIKGDILNGNPETALPEYDAALEIDPNSPVAYASKGIALVTAGRAREAFSPVQIALRLSPKDPSASNWHFFLCHAHVHLHEYDKAVEECRRSISLNKLNWFPYADLISVYGATG
jgi:adenylate cyclase